LGVVWLFLFCFLSLLFFVGGFLFVFVASVLLVNVIYLLY
jgi:hypothetical protein